jgi:hypothetical protein
MGFFEDYKSLFSTVDVKTAVNVEWVLKILDALPEMSGTTLGLARLNGNYTFWCYQCTDIDITIILGKTTNMPIVVIIVNLLYKTEDKYYTAD